MHRLDGCIQKTEPVVFPFGWTCRTMVKRGVIMIKVKLS